jgi:hypothetical protein
LQTPSPLKRPSSPSRGRLTLASCLPGDVNASIFLSRGRWRFLAKHHHTKKQIDPHQGSTCFFIFLFIEFVALAPAATAATVATAAAHTAEATTASAT